jgi:DUF4097 and DUF4098 domain-containing protein YvlB
MKGTAMRISRSGATLLGLAVAVSTACSINLNAEQYVGKEQKNFAVTGKTELELKTFDGSIEVTSWDKPQVAVTIERRAGSQAEAEALKVTSEQTGNRIVIHAVKPEREDVHVGWNQGRSVRFVVTIPRTTDLNATSGDGSIAVAGVTGRVDVRSGDGSITANDVSGDVGIETGDGSVSAEAISGNLKINTGDGSISVKGQPRALMAHTGDGSVSVDVTSATAPGSDWELTTGDGGIHVALPAGFNAQIDAHTGDGGIDANAWGLRATGEDRNDLQGAIGSGGPTLRLRTGDGGITLTKR